MRVGIITDEAIRLHAGRPDLEQRKCKRWKLPKLVRNLTYGAVTVFVVGVISVMLAAYFCQEVPLDVVRSVLK